jgi:hypothetical protein
MTISEKSLKMSTRSANEVSLPIAWPLAGSLIVTAIAVALVCTPPPKTLHTWTQIFTRATVYLLVAGVVHALAVWSVCTVRRETEVKGLPLILPIIWSAWVVVVWLPLISLLTAEHSPLVVAILPVTIIFATLLLRWRRTHFAADDDDAASFSVKAMPFQLLESPPLWRMLLPAVVTAIAAQGGVAMLAQGHAWIAGCLFGAGAIYPVERGLGQTRPPDGEGRVNVWWRTAAGNSLIVWLLILLALVPFMAAYASGELSVWLGIKARTIPAWAPVTVAHNRSSGYTGIILVQPKKSQEIVAPAPMTTTIGSLKDAKVIKFDGAYWYFKWPEARPAANATVTQGDPVKKHIYSTDNYPLTMEAHQPLGKSLAVNCCRSLRVDVTNADNVPGSITIEVRLGNALSSTNVHDISLGRIVLPTSTVSPMPLNRPPVDDTLTFKVPRTARGAMFNEITVRIMPEGSRSLAGAQVAIRDFVLQP